MTLKLYLDRGSQPSRAVLVFCDINKIPYQLHSVQIGLA